MSDEADTSVAVEPIDETSSRVKTKGKKSRSKSRERSRSKSRERVDASAVNARTEEADLEPDMGAKIPHEEQRARLERFFGNDRSIEADGASVTYATQPAHVKQYKMKKRFGEDVDLGRDSVIDDGLDLEASESSEQSPDPSQSRRVQKFFGESFDVAEKMQEEKIGLRRTTSKNFQPHTVDVGKLNKFFGRHTHIERQVNDLSSPRSDEDGDEEWDEELDGEAGEMQKSKRDRKLRKYFGTNVDAEKAKEDKQFEKQPDHVKEYRLRKHFGDHVVVDHISGEGDKPPSVHGSMGPASASASFGVPGELRQFRKLTTFFGAKPDDAARAASPPSTRPQPSESSESDITSETESTVSPVTTTLTPEASKKHEK